MQDEISEFNELIQSSLDLEKQDSYNEAELLGLIHQRVTELLETNVELLFSYMYRLDIEESKIQYAINEPSDTPTSEALAVLILERQKARAETKKKYKQEPIEGWDSF